MDERVQRLVDKEEIRELAYRYALAWDTRDPDALVELFVNDVRLGPLGTGRAALRDYIDQQMALMGPTVMFVGNHTIELEDDDRARGVVYCHCEGQVGDDWLVQMIQYWDRYRRRDGVWHFLTRRHLLWYSVPLGTKPVWPAIPVHPEIEVGLGELPEAWPSWPRFWDRAGFAPPGMRSPDDGG